MGEQEWLLVAQLDFLDYWVIYQRTLRKMTAVYCNGFLPCVGQIVYDAKPSVNFFMFGLFGLFLCFLIIQAGETGGPYLAICRLH